MNLLTIPLPTLRRALELAEEREALVEELNGLLGERVVTKVPTKSAAAKRTNAGARRYWREWRKKKEAASAA